MYREGFARFATVNYSSDFSESDNLVMHLTNVSFQKKAEDYNEENGGKWSYQNLLYYIECTYGKMQSEKLHEDILSVIILSLKSVNIR